MVETKLTGPTMAERIANQQRNSGDVRHADTVAHAKVGAGWAHHQVHHSYNRSYGGDEEAHEARPGVAQPEHEERGEE